MVAILVDAGTHNMHHNMHKGRNDTVQDNHPLSHMTTYPDIGHRKPTSS